MTKFTKPLPYRLKVKEVVSGRYSEGTRPISWDERFSGIETIVTECGEVMTLLSNGGQSTPAPGWELLITKQITEESIGSSFTWTLYGISRQ